LYTWFGKNQVRLYVNGAKKISIGGGPCGPLSKYAPDSICIIIIIILILIIITTITIVSEVDDASIALGFESTQVFEADE